jgi:preprotein translocase subunit SecE
VQNKEEMTKIKLYFEDTYNELVNKVSWPTRSELQSSAIIVMVASFIIAVIIYAMDSAFSNLMQLIYGMFY